MWKARVPAAADSPAHPICAPTCETPLLLLLLPYPLITPSYSSPRFLLPAPSFSLCLCNFQPPLLFSCPGDSTGIDCWWSAVSTLRCCCLSRLPPGGALSTKLFRILLGLIFSSNSLLPTRCACVMQRKTVQFKAVFNTWLLLALRLL